MFGFLARSPSVYREEVQFTDTADIGLHITLRLGGQDRNGSTGPSPKGTLAEWEGGNSLTWSGVNGGQ